MTERDWYTLASINWAVTLLLRFRFAASAETDTIVEAVQQVNEAADADETVAVPV